jgi:hypothetical protein
MEEYVVTGHLVPLAMRSGSGEAVPHLSVSRFLILLRKIADLQWSVRIWAATLAMAFRALSKQLSLTDLLGAVVLGIAVLCRFILIVVE